MNIADIQREIVKYQGFIQDLRREERSIQAREKTLASQPQVGGDHLDQNLASFLPPHLMPGNVGGFNTVRWPFWHVAELDFGLNPTLTATSTLTRSFQVTQEAAVLMMAVSRSADEYSTSGDLGPYTVQFRDRQSTRQFQDRGIPIQMIGQSGNPTILPTPLLIMPNAFVDVTMGTWLPAAPFSQATTGSGKHEFTFFGYRIRIEDAEKVLSTIFR